MINSDIKSMSKEQSDAIFGQIAWLAREIFSNMDLSSDLIKAAQMLLLKSSMPQDPAEITKEFIADSLFPKAVDSVFAAYHRSCTRFCLSRTQDDNLSEDVAQEAIRLLLLSPKKVDNIGAWLIQVTYNLLCAHYKESEKDKELYQKLSLEASSYENWLTSSDLMVLKDLSPALVDQLLKSDEYQRYYEIISYDNIKDYAAFHNVSVKTAQKRKEVAHRNLRSMVLLSFGWRDSPNILNYNQYYAIQKFIREVIRMCSGDEDVQWLKSLSPEQAKDVKNIKEITEWGIVATGERSFKLYMFTMFGDGQPFMITFNIAMNERNSISIQSCKVNQLYMTVPDSVKARVPMDKGRAIWNYKQIISLLKEN